MRAAVDAPWFAGRDVLVAGAGVTGRSVARALRDLGATVTVTDSNPVRLAELEPLGVRLRDGLTEPPEDTSLLVTSPGWRPSTPLLASAARRGIEVIGDVELAWRIGQAGEHPPTWLAVTGTNGKTTTVGMLESILRSAGVDAVACGNVGFAVLDAVLAGHETLAVELSSFQLHYSNTLAARAAVVLNVAEDHLDWHGSLAAYAADKGKIYQRCGVAVYNAGDAWSTALAERNAPAEAVRVACTEVKPSVDTPGRPDGPSADTVRVLGDELCEVPADGAPLPLARLDDVRLPGSHNVANALAAAALARARGVPAEAVGVGLREFRPGAHRTVEVAEIAGVRYVNDSKATNPHAAAGSLRAYPHLVWIAGGMLKGSSVDELVTEFAGRLRGAVLLGTDADVIEDAIARHAPDLPRVRIPSGEDGPMAAAVNAASTLARPGDVVLLAPAAASIDMFDNYARRGDEFTAAVRALAAGEG